MFLFINNIKKIIIKYIIIFYTKLHIKRLWFALKIILSLIGISSYA